MPTPPGTQQTRQHPTLREGLHHNMRALVKERPAPGAVYREDFPEPVCGGADVVVRVEAVAICGTDVHLYEWDRSGQDFRPKLPLVMGHECSGVVVEVGPEVRGIREGQRVALETHFPCGNCFPCRTGDAHNCLNMGLLGLRNDGAFADYVKVPANVCFPLPDAVSFEEGALFEPAGVAVHAMQRADLKPGDSVLVCGCGPIGLIAVQLCLAAGAGQVIALDVNPYRLKIAESLGAVVFNPLQDDVKAGVLDLCRRRGGVDVALEVSGNPVVFETIFDYIRREGTLVAVGLPGRAVPVDISRDIAKRGITLTGVFGRRLWDTWEILASLVEAKRVDLGRIITHRLELADFERGFELVRGDAAKVVFRM